MYIFANQTGPIPLNELDANFALVPNYANTAGAVTNSSQPNIASVGTLSYLSVTGNVTGSNLVMSTVTANTLTGSLTTASQPNVTSLGALTSLSVVGNITTGNITAAAKVTAAAIFGTINTSAQPYITSTGTLDSLTISGDSTVGGNIVIQGNATIQGTTFTVDSQTLNIADKNITVANNVSTSALINGAGINAGNPVVSYLQYSDVNKGWGTANNFSVGGNLTVTGAAFATTAANGTSNTQLATTAFVLNNGLPSGCIVLWSGSSGSIPSGWYLCDGGNSTPDLRDRFIVGAGNVYAVGNVGGSTDSIVVTHSHTATSNVTDPGHFHTVVANPGGSSGAFGGGTSSSATSINTDTKTTGITVSTTVDSTGSSGTNANLPPYYALCYIMKA